MHRSFTLSFITLAAFSFLLIGCEQAPVPDKITVTLTSDGEAQTLSLSPGQTVRDALAAGSVILGELDRVRPPELTLLQDGMAITVTRVVQTTEVETQTVPYETQTINDTTIPAGDKRVQQAGRNGILEITYRLTYEDGQRTERQEVNRQLVATPVAEIVRVGLQGAFDAIPVSGTIVYLSGNNAYVMREISGNQRPLTTEGDLDGRVLSLSPDGRWLLYTRAATATLNSLWLVDTALAKPEAKALKIDGVLWAAFSPDGKSIAYTLADPSPGAPGWRAYNDLSIVAFGDGKLGAREQIVKQSSGAKYGWWGTTYAWSPDSKLIAYANTEAIGVISPTARLTKTLALTNFVAYNTHSTWAWTPTPAWSPDGHFLVSAIHASSPTGESDEDSPAFDVVALAVDGSFSARLVAGAGMWSAPTWSPGSLESSRIIYGEAETPYTSDTSRYFLYSMDRDGSNHAQLFPDADAVGLDGLPDYNFAPDGRSLVVAYRGDLYVISLVTGNNRRLTAQGDISHPGWSN